MAGFLLSGAPAEARILKTRRSLTQLELTVGSGLEFETDSDLTQYETPLLVEYGFTETVKLTFEPNYVVLRSKTAEPSASGWGDLETTLTWESIEERRWRPGFSLEATVKWPTASNVQFGTGKKDYSLGVILSKSRRSLSMDADAIYTRVGGSGGAGDFNALEGSLAFEWAMSFVFDLEGEILATSGGFTSRPGTISGLGTGDQGGREIEGTLGVAEHLLRRLKLEQGGILKSDGSWQLALAWEWEFGSGR